MVDTSKIDISKIDYEFSYRQVDKEHLAEFLAIYRSLPLLWDTQDKDYYNKFKKAKAYNTLLTKYKEKFPHATENDVKKRLNALRTNYRKELRKVVRYLKMGEVYEPKLWYFNDLSFLRGLKRPSGSGGNTDDSIEQKMDNDDLDDTDDFEQASTSGSHNDQEETKPIEQIDVKPKIKHKKCVRPNVSVITELKETEPEEPYIWYQEPTTEQNNTDNCYYWAQAWAADLRKMDATQRIYAKKAIAEILMEGQLGQLHRNSVRINT